ncbi:DUF6907 domain-containing protein [Streptomyces apocyni]|uniref:DUF6907 domain-containing protein n=1 Tax=Streptomyces apocyni TaxID=2654677 RepID=UPI0012EA21D6|nr:hypothetical protein [Streptomyces apocyni]
MHSIAQASTATPSDQRPSISPQLITTVVAALTASDAAPAIITEARRMIATGQVHETASEVVRKQDNESLREFFACLDVIIGRVVDHQPLTPLVNAAEHVTQTAAADRAPGHYPWCQPGQCTNLRYDGDGGEPYFEHVGPHVDLPLPDGMDCDHNELLSAELGDADDAIGGPLVSFNSGGNGVLLDPDDLTKVIGDLAAFTDSLRAMHRQMTAQQAEATA